METYEAAHMTLSDEDYIEKYGSLDRGVALPEPFGWLVSPEAAVDETAAARARLTLLSVLPDALEKAQPSGRRAQGADKTEFTALEYPPRESGLPGLSLYLRRRAGEENFELFTTAPALPGTRAEAEVLAVHADENGVSGDAALKFGQAVFTCALPYFFYDGPFLEPGRKCVFEVSAVAAGQSFGPASELAPGEVFSVSSGPFYEQALQDFLSQHPGLGREALPEVNVSTENLQLISPHGSDACLMELRCRAEKAARLEFFSSAVLRLDCVLDQAFGESPLAVYAAETPEWTVEKLSGQFIAGLFWVSARLVPESIPKH